MKPDLAPILVYDFGELEECLNKGIPFIPIHAGTPKARLEEIQKLCTESTLVADLAYIVMTSGSTGKPKAVQITKANLQSFIDLLRREGLIPSPADVAANGFSFGFDGSLILFLACRESGAKFCHIESSLSEDCPLPPETSIWSSTPSSLSRLLLYKNFNQQHYPRLKRFYFGGEILTAQNVKNIKSRFPQAEVWNMYGPTEGSIMASAQKINDLMPTHYSSMPIGQIQSSSFLSLIPVAEKLFEIQIRGPSVSPGYLNTTSENFETLANGVRTYNTGDLCTVQDDLIFFSGRRDQQIKLHGYRIEPSEVEAIVRNVPAVTNCLCAGLERDNKVQRIICFVKFNENSNFSVEQLKTHLKNSLPSYMLPHEIICVADWPLTAHLKSDKEALIKKYFPASFKVRP